MVFKQVIAVRTDLGMGRGKLAAQVAHASVSAFLAARELRPEWASGWLAEGQKKVVVRVSSLDRLLSLKREAEVRGLPSYLVSDAGLTQLEPGTVTALGIGPAPEDEVDRLTRDLPLL